MNVKISGSKIFWDKDTGNEADTINKIRDDAEKYFYTDIAKGKTLVFSEWDYNSKEISYSLI